MFNPMPGTVVHCMSDAYGEIWKHGNRNRLEAWVGKRDELLRNVAAAQRRPFMAPAPGYGRPVPEEFRNASVDARSDV
jgi:hypothetical protein